MRIPSLISNSYKLGRVVTNPARLCVPQQRFLSTYRFSNDESGNKLIEKAFPSMIPEQEFVKTTFQLLNPVGFKKSNTIPCVGLCRDELTSPLLDIIDRTWRESEAVAKSYTFIMSSLAGMLFLGDTGMTAAIDHAPRDENGIERFVFYSFPHIFLSLFNFLCDFLLYNHLIHLLLYPIPIFIIFSNFVLDIGFNEKGEVGKLKRHGIPDDSACCGALIGFHNELKNGFIKMESNPDDVEQICLKQRLMKNININKEVPDLVSLTKLAHTTVLSDLEGLISRNLEKKPRNCEYAVFSGVHIHAPLGNFLWPGPCYVVTHPDPTSSVKTNLAINK